MAPQLASPKTVFISYRRTNFPWALNIFQYLTQHGFDVFFDFEGIGAGDFEQIIIGNILSRAHFLVVLTPSALERCSNEGDWLRREIETAIANKRNIVPLFIEGFSFGTPAIAGQLTGKLAPLKHYNGLGMPAEYIFAAMDKLRTQFLNVHPDAMFHPATPAAEAVAAAQSSAAAAAPQVTEEQLTAQEYFERAYALSNPDEEIRLNTKAIELQPNFPEAYNNRGIAHEANGDLAAAIRDYNQAIQLKPDYAIAYNNRGIAHKAKGNPAAAIRDYDQAIQLKPDYANAYYNRGIAHKANGDLAAAFRDYNQAIQLNPGHPEAHNNRANAHKAKGNFAAAFRDYDQAIQLKPDYANAYYNRGSAHKANGDLAAAFRDYNQAIQLKPNYADAYYNRGVIHETTGATSEAIADLQHYLDLGGGERDGDTEAVKARIERLKAKLARR